MGVNVFALEIPAKWIVVGATICAWDFLSIVDVNRSFVSLGSVITVSQMSLKTKA